MIAHNAANVIVVFNSDGIEQYESVLADQDVRGINMSISDIGPKTFIAVRSDDTGKIQILHRVETQHQIMVPVIDQETGESTEKKLKKWNSQCYAVRCIYEQPTTVSRPIWSRVQTSVWPTPKNTWR